MLKRNAIWLFYAVFFVLAIVFHKGENLFLSKGAYALGKPLVWLVLFGFLGYSLYCTSKENFFKTIKRTWPCLWSRQIGLELYIGLGLTMFVMYLNEGSLVVPALWFLPILIFANLATLLYIALNYDQIVRHFL